MTHTLKTSGFISKFYSLLKVLLIQFRTKILNPLLSMMNLMQKFTYSIKKSSRQKYYHTSLDTTILLLLFGNSIFMVLKRLKVEELLPLLIHLYKREIGINHIT